RTSICRTGTTSTIGPSAATAGNAQQPSNSHGSARNSTVMISPFFLVEAESNRPPRQWEPCKLFPYIFALLAHAAAADQQANTQGIERGSRQQHEADGHADADVGHPENAVAKGVDHM